MAAMLLPAPAAARQQAAARIGPGGAQPAPQYQQVLSGDRSLPQGTACAVPAGGDYDIDDDRLIEVCSLAQLNAIRWDGDGDGSATAAGHAAAFSGAATGMGCPAPGCNGYELTADLDFDTDGDGNAGAGDTYWNAGKGWAPIDWLSGEPVVFEGNGHTISNLFVDTNSSNAGLFACVCSSVVRNLGLESVDVSGTKYVGGLAGTSRAGTITGSYTTGEVSGGSSVGGLVGIQSFGSIADSYSTADVSADGTGDNEFIGGLVGRNWGDVMGSFAAGNVSGASAVKVGGLVGENWGNIVAAYASGDMTGTGNPAGGLVGFNQKRIAASYAVGDLSRSRTAGGLTAYPRSDYDRYDLLSDTTASYWDTQTTGVSWRTGDGDGKTTAELQGPTGYTGLYASWNVDLDGDGSADDPWDFGTSAQYPVLKGLGMSVADQRSQMPGAAGSQPAASSEQSAPQQAKGTYSVTATASVVEGETATVTITLSEAAPEDGVKFTLKRGWRRDGSDASNADVGNIARSATVPQGSRTAQVDIVTIDDGYIEDDKILTVIVTAATPGWVTEGSGKDTARTTIQDNDTAGVTVSHSTLDVPEGGTATYTVVLDAAPVGVVTITPSSGDEGAVTVSPASAVFGSRNWNIPQSFTVSGEADADADDESVTISHRVTVGRGIEYLGVVAPSPIVTVADNTPPPMEPEPEQQRLDTATMPGPVEGLVLSLTANGAIDVTWQAPQSGDAPENYIVHLRNQDSGKGNNRKVKAPKTTTTWRNLQAGATYRVWVRAQNAGGKGDRVRAFITVPGPPTQ